MTKPKIFISHSTKNDDNLAFLEKLYNSLDECKHFDLLVDRKKLYPGDKWHYKINEWMHECDAAILLLTKDALESNWVIAESTFTAVRDRLEPKFKLLPVALGGVTASDISGHQFLGTGSAADLIQTQFITASEDDVIIDSIVKELNSLQSIETPFDKIGNVIARLLNKVDKDVLGGVLKELGEERPASLSIEKEKYSDSLVRYLFRNNQDCLDNFKNILDKIRPKLDVDSSQEFYKYIRSFWVHGGAASHLLAIEQSQLKMTAMNGNYLPHFTCERYIEKAWPITDCYQYIRVSNSNDFQVIQEQMRDHFQVSKNPANRLPPEICDEDIQTSDDPIIVCMQGSQEEGGIPDSRTREELVQTYPNVIFIIGTGELLPDSLPNDVIGIKPELEIDAEKRQWSAERRTNNFLKKYCEF